MKKLIVLSLMALATLGSCKKGDTGAPGKDGINGTNGNANVKSGVATVYDSQWFWDASDYSQNVTLNYDAITEDIVSSGAVLVFMSTNTTTGSFIALPVTILQSNPQLSFSYSYSYKQVKVSLTNTNYTRLTMNGAITFKVLAIAASTLRQHPNTNWKDYSQAMSAINEVKETK